jgi:predicted phage terminase large subunit-like protein
MSKRTREDHRTLDAALRLDLAAFIQGAFEEVVPGSRFLPNWHIEAIAYHLEQVFAGQIKRLIITIPPRHLKSICASVAFPAWVLGHDPTRRIVTVSYGDDLAGKHALDCRRIMESARYRRLFPATRLSRSKNTANEYVTTRGGYRYSASVGGALTGRGGSLIICDDLLKPADALSDLRRQAVNDWFDNTLFSRLDNKAEDAIVIVMQRLHLEDLVGHVLEQGDWVQLNLPAIAEVDASIPIGPGQYYHRRRGEPLHPAREPDEVLRQIRKTLGAYTFSAQYQQLPVPVEGSILQWRWFRRYKGTYRTRRPDDVIIQSWDPAATPGENSDYSVCTTWLVRDGKYFLVDVFRERLDYPDLRRAVYRLIEQWQPNEVVIEGMNSGRALFQELRAQAIKGRGPLRVMQILCAEPRESKVTRMAVHSPVIEAGQVLLPESAPWLDDLQREIAQFPHGRYDDQVDSLSQFLYRMAHPSPIYRRPAPPPPEEQPPGRRLRAPGWPRAGICFD